MPKTNKSYKHPADMIYKLSVDTIVSMKGGTITKGDIHMGKIKANIKPDISWGYIFDISITPLNKDECTLDFEYYAGNLFGGKAIAGGGKKANQLAEDFIQGLEERIRRVEIKYG